MNIGSREYKSRNSSQRRSVKQMFLKISQNSHEITCVRASFLLKSQEKEIPAQLFSCEFCAIFKNTLLKVPSCKLCNNKITIASTQIPNTEIFAFIAVLVLKLLSRILLQYFFNLHDCTFNRLPPGDYLCRLWRKVVRDVLTFPLKTHSKV